MSRPLYPLFEPGRMTRRSFVTGSASFAAAALLASCRTGGRVAAAPKLPAYQVLRAVGSVLADAVREPVFVGRLGGEEFLVVLPQTGLEAARQAAERIREQVGALKTRHLLDASQLTVSLGVTVSRPGQDGLSDLLRRADEALYAAKHGGRNRVATQDTPAGAA